MTKNQHVSVCGVQERACFEWGPEEAASYRKRLGDAMLALRDRLARVPLDEREPIREEWAERQIDRLDRLYLNSTMSEVEYQRYLAKIDKVTIEA